MINELNMLHRFKVTDQKIHLNYKGKNDNFTLDKSDTYHLTPVIKLKIIYNGTNQNCVQPYKMRMRRVQQFL